MAIALDRVFSQSTAAASLASYRTQPGDVIISPFSKCGTTWLQQTFHTLRTRGDMDFDDISSVVPWIETADLLGIDLNARQRAMPRGFKSHLPYDQIPRGARYVVSFRDPKDALVSLYRFFEGWWFEPGAISIGEFAKFRLGPRGESRGYWHHLLSWWEQRHNRDVLLFSYEQMSSEPERTVHRLAAFCGIALDPDLLALTLERSSLPFMLAHKDKFDDRPLRLASETAAGLPGGADASKVRAGKVGAHGSELPPEISDLWDSIWAESVAPRTGFATYRELESAVRLIY